MLKMENRVFVAGIDKHHEDDRNATNGIELGDFLMHGVDRIRSFLFDAWFELTAVLHVPESILRKEATSYGIGNRS